MKTIHIQASDASTRIDTFLHGALPEHSRSEIVKHIKNGHITVNGQEVKASYLLREKDSIEIATLKKVDLSILKPNFSLVIDILFENEHFLIIDKPPGIQVHPSHIENKHTLSNWLIAKYPFIQNIGEDPSRPGIVHRLDKDTSGVMIIAKTQETFYLLKELFSHRNITKKYLALVHGVPHPSSGDINLPIARSHSFRKQTIVRPGVRHKGEAREAFTQYKILSSFPLSSNDIPLEPNNHYSLVGASPKTGRMHQIRIHLSSIGHPIVGDSLYKRKECPNPCEVKRFLLHAHSLSFSLFKEQYTFLAPIPDDFLLFLKAQEMFKLPLS